MENVYEIAGFSTLLIVAGIVELFKKFNVSGNWLVVISMLVGTIFGVVYQLYILYPAAQAWIEVGYFGIGMGLGASGLYSITKRMTSTK